MAGTDGVTPLNKDNVLHKAAPDTRIGNQTFVDGAPVLTGATLRMPFRYFAEAAGGLPRFHDSTIINLPFPMVLLAKPTTYSIQIAQTQGCSLEIMTFNPWPTPADANYRDRRSVGLQVSPYYGGGVLATTMDGASPSSINIGSVTSGFQNRLNEYGFGWIQIDQEIMQYSGIAGTALTGIAARGSYGTYAVGHSPGAIVRLMATGILAEGEILLSGF